ncbi:D-alanine--poly(phosphoribitol) ligase subunit DltA [Vagococcus fluvialis]|uniref:D-alanine--poly(phosphoribitol) ligase subunit DltA n=1 Tax=Vagococcus fluvialis TaxID=2738 RepID=UPI003B223EAF
MKNLIITKIKEWAEKAPNTYFFDEGDSTLTYGELERYSDALASHLESNFSKKQNILVYGGQDSRMIISFLAATKAGHCYVPVDIHTPKDRVEMILEESEATCVISLGEWPLDKGKVITEDLFEELVTLNKKPNLANMVTGNDNYYTIFTSGTTGKPKGVQITYDNLVSFTDWMLSDFNLKTGQRFLCQAPFSFDLSVMDLYPSLLSGGTLVPLEKADVDNFSRLFARLPEMDLNVWVSTPSLVEICLLSPDFNDEKLPGLENFQFCGEELPHAVAQKLMERFPKADIYNTYGPTEATVAITSVLINQEVLDRNERLPLGRVKADTSLVILDEEGNASEEGTIGEVLIVGPGVSKGYFNQEEKTKEAFITFEDQAAYKTGDAGLIKNGLLYYKGRLDFQIKWHGYRMELGDIDHHIMEVDMVRNACVVPRYNKNHKVQQLIAYVVLNEGVTGDAKELGNLVKEELQKSVMDYMVPQRFVFVENLPLTSNGKVDRKKLIEEVNL